MWPILGRFIIPLTIISLSLPMYSIYVCMHVYTLLFSLLFCIIIIIIIFVSIIINITIAEKAYAKFYKSFQAIEGGNVDSALVDMTGGVAERWDWAEDDDAKEAVRDGSLWLRLLKHASKGYLIGAGSTMGEDDSEANASDLGIVQSHAYSVLRVEQVDDVQLVQLRNPWGRKEWTGDWGDDSELWESAGGRRLKAKVGFEKSDDGKFWMNWQDFTMNFSVLEICKVFHRDTFADHGVINEVWGKDGDDELQVAVTPLDSDGCLLVLSLEQDDVRGDDVKICDGFPRITIAIYSNKGLPVHTASKTFGRLLGKIN